MCTPIFYHDDTTVNNLLLTQIKINRLHGKSPIHYKKERMGKETLALSCRVRV